MESCHFTIITTADGRESTVSKDGKIAFSLTGATVCYYDEQAEVCIEIYGKTVTVRRRGDYSLHLRLEQGQLCKGTIGIGGSEGEVLTKTEYLAWSVKEKFLLLSLRYDLLVSGETQKMKIRLSARSKE